MNFDSPQYRLARAIERLAKRVKELESFDNAMFEIKATAGRPTARGEYHFVINTNDNTVELYSDGAWRNLIGGAGGYTDEDAQDAVGTILTDTASINFTYDDVTPEILAAVLPAGVDHDLLANFVGNEHIDHTGVTLTAGAHLTGGGDISANRSFAVDDDFVLNTGDQIDGNLIIDNTATEALLIRKDADAGDVLIVDTTNSEVEVYDRLGIGTTPVYTLDVNAGTVNAVALFESTDPDMFIYMRDGDSTGAGKVRIAADGDDLELWAGGVDRVHISSNGKMEFNWATENLELIDAGSVGATEQDWIEVEVGNVQGYIRVFAAK